MTFLFSAWAQIRGIKTQKDTNTQQSPSRVPVAHAVTFSHHDLAKKMSRPKSTTQLYPYHPATPVRHQRASYFWFSGRRARTALPARQISMLRISSISASNFSR